ncbi:hypothetical protein DRH29_03320 [candidate division Kazan bacterium]|uniref:Uncharacterized protein n=1 Tax=candidate division Kazan bacterium TaxID=2202143 RepID=A0A420ZCI3_UNCK3|nr:MAG: hypothetical protein DRH29_03320 [candidate division Kazan bacterium]
MNRSLNRFLLALLTIVTSIIWGCASVPKEIVELSYTMGQDLEVLQMSYRSLIQAHFNGLRAQREDFLNNHLIPKFIENYLFIYKTTA